MPDLVSSRVRDFVAQLVQFDDNLTDFYVLLGMTIQQRAEVTRDRQTAEWALECQDIAATSSKEWTGVRHILFDGPIGAVAPQVPAATYPAAPDPIAPPGIEPRYRAHSKTIKANANYTEAMGQALGLISPSSPPVPAVPTATITATGPHQSQIDWVKRHYLAVQIECQRGNETEWTVLGIDMVAPYVDAREVLVAGQPEVRRYRLRYLDKDGLVGDYSDVMSVTVGP